MPASIRAGVAPSARAPPARAGPAKISRSAAISLGESGASPRRIPPGLIAIAVVLVIAGSVFNNWHREALLAALRESVLTLAIVATLLAILAAIEILLHGRPRLWGRIGGLAIVSGVVLWRLFHGGSTII